MSSPSELHRPGRRVAVVMWSTGAPIHMSPRGQRADCLVEALEGTSEVERVGPDRIPAWLAGDKSRVGTSRPRELAKAVLGSVLIDKFEVSAWRELRTWDPAVDAAVLIGYPFSPLAFAAGRLAAAGIPYVVDVGDPWVLTNPYPVGGTITRRRAARLERRLWTNARGAMVTTPLQGQALKERFPQLSVLVRPNGYRLPEATDIVPPPEGRSWPADELRLVHYGSLYGERAHFERIFERLVSDGRWSRIVLHQFGPDWEGVLKRLPTSVDVELHSPVPWHQVVAEARDFDAAVVIGWRNPGQMPSKAVQYLTLPIPRIAMTGPRADDALASYVTGKPGWATVRDGDVDAGEAVARVVSRVWTSPELAPPESESWPAVGRQLAAFLAEHS